MKICFGALALMLSLSACQKAQKVPASPQSQASDAKAIAPPSLISTLAKDPQHGWIAVMRDLYPNEFNQVAEELQQQVNLGADPIAAKLSMLSVVKPFMVAHRTVAREAPDEDLVEYLRKNTAVAETLLKSNPKACTDVFQGGLDPATTLPDATWRKMSDATAQLLRTARSAEESPTIRQDVSLTPTDIQAWYEGMRAIGAGPEIFEFLNDPARKAAATLSEKCRVRVTMMQGALQLPEPLAAKITLNILK